MVSNQEDFVTSFTEETCQQVPSKVLQNTTVVSLTKSRLPKYDNSLQCKSSGQQIPEKLVKIELN